MLSISKWTAKDVCAWLETLPFLKKETYAWFEKNEIDGPALLQMDETRLENVPGLGKAGPRIKFIYAMDNIGKIEFRFQWPDGREFTAPVFPDADVETAISSALSALRINDSPKDYELYSEGLLLSLNAKIISKGHQVYTLVPKPKSTTISNVHGSVVNLGGTGNEIYYSGPGKTK